MNPRNPRWQSPETRRARSAAFWKLLVAATSGAALSAVVVVSCLDGAQRDRALDDEPLVLVRTTSAPMPTGADPNASMPEPGRSSSTVVVTTGGAVEASPGDPVVVVETTVSALPALATPRLAPPVLASQAEPGASAAVPQVVVAEPARPLDADAAPPAPKVLRDARGNVIDPDNLGTNPNAPAMSAGAGQLKTDAPPWAASAFPSDPNAGAGRFTTDAPPSSASSFQSNPDAGAGPFTTEWNIPAYGYWPY